MHERLKISPHAHTGRLVPHKHTSYAALAFMALVLVFVLSALSISALADHPPAQSGYVGLTGKVPSNPPKIAATITKPVNGQHIGASPVTVIGTCTKGLIVEVFKNNIFAGSAECTDKGTFSIDIDLLYGQNILVARVYDALDQQGPDSNSVSVFYDAIPPQTDPLANLSFSDLQMLLRSSPVYRGVFPNQPLTVPLEIIGGKGPFAVRVDWADNSNDLVPRGDNLPFNTTHIYKKPGSYQITFQATDSQKRVAFLSVVAVINGSAEFLGSTAPSTPLKKSLFIAWPLLLIVIVMITSFWLGEKREKHVLERKYQFE